MPFRWFLVLAGACSFSADLPAQGGSLDAPKADAAGGDGSSASCTPALRGTSYSSTGSATSVTVLTPSVQAGDAMLAIVLYQSDSDEAVGTISAPTGWTLVRSDSHGGVGAIGQSVYIRFAEAVEPPTHIFTSGPSKRFIAIVQAYSGVKASAPIAAHEGRANVPSTMVTTPDLTVPECSMVVGAFGSRSLSTFTPPPLLTERLELTNNMSAMMSIEIADGIMAGATGMLAATASTSAHNIGQAIALAAE